MKRIWNRGFRDIEDELRAARPDPRPEFVASLAQQVRAEARQARSAGFRIAFAGGLTVVMLVALAAVGGVSYAANSVVGAARTLEAVLGPESERQVVVVDGLTAGSDQYRPGFGWGDPNHTHTGPPGLQRQGRTPRARLDRNDPRFVRVSTRVTVDEQAHLTISVVGPGGKALQLSQRRSNVGQGVTGPTTKNIQYTVLIPRSIAIELAIPTNLLVRGKTYFIVITATDPSGQRRTIRIKFRY